MVSIEYAEAAVEVLDILKHTRKEDVEKIPKKFIEFLEENSSKTYVSNLDHSKLIKDMVLKQKTQDILGLIYLKYWANKDEAKKFRDKIKENERKHQQELRELYNPENIFKPKMKEKINTEETQLQVIPKENFIQQIINKIKEIFKKR